jgi:hypothetical protein
MPRTNAQVNNLETYSHDPTRYRQRFLRALHETTPEVMMALRDDLLPLYTSSALFRAVSLKLTFLKTEPEAPPATPAQIESFKRAIDQWVEEFGLRDQWLLEVAVVTLDHWKKRNDALAALNWAELPFLSRPLTLDGREIEFRHAGWRVETECWSEFAARNTAAFKQHLSSYKETIRGDMRDLGLSLPPDIRNSEHYTWLALYQVRGFSPAKIAEFLNSDQETLPENTILKAVTRAAGLVGLTLRRSQKGKGPRHPRIGTGKSRRRKT